jgi:hypothetical protein
MAISTTFTLKFAGAAVERGLARVQSAFKSLGGVAMKIGKSLLSPFAALTALLGTGALVGGLASFVKGSSAAASSVESLTTQFTTLLGSATAAKERMEEITKFAASTPFEIQELAATSKLLEVMGGKLISTGDGLQLVGDAAAMAGQPLQEVGLHVGRLFSAITSGTSAGESVNRLQELGLITGATKIKFEELAAAQKKGTAATLTGERALKLLQDVMKKSQGGMAALSTTTAGKLSNMRDNIDRLKVAFGTGFNIGLKNALDRVNEFLPKMLDKFKDFGLETGKIMIQLMDAFEQGRIGEIFMAALDTGVARLGEELLALMTHAGNTFFDALENRATKSVVWKTLTWGGLDVETPKTKTGKDKTDMSYSELRAEYANMFGSQNNADILRQSLQKQGRHPRISGFEYAPEGANTGMFDRDGIMVMHSINRGIDALNQKLAPQP